MRVRIRHRPSRRQAAATRGRADARLISAGRFLEEYVPVHCKPSTAGTSTSRSVKLSSSTPVIGNPQGDGDPAQATSPNCTMACGRLPIRPTGPSGCFQRCSTWPKLWGLAPGRLEPLPARQALQGGEARAVPVAGRDRAAGPGPARGRRRDALGSSRLPPASADGLPDVGDPRPSLGLCEGRLYRASRCQDRRTGRATRS